MNIRTLATAFLFALSITGCERGKEKTITGKFSLSESPSDTDAPDAIEFRPDGSCLVDSGERTGIPGKYHVSPDGHLSISTNAGSHTGYTYQYQLLKHTLVLSPNENVSLIYVRLPEGLHPQFTEIVGIFQMHTDLGDSATEITADDKFRVHLRSLVPEEHTYYDISMDGKCSYAKGVVTYVPEHSDAPQQDKYLRDFIVKRDAKGLWGVDPFHDTVVCETPGTDLSLPPPPKGYRNGRQP
jgi:hypothetical protein